MCAPNEKSEAIAMLELIDPKRFENQGCWINIGRVLFTIYNGEEAGLQVWIQYSERAKVPDVGLCSILYPTFDTSEGSTVKTLAWYAREDAPTAYQAWQTQRINQGIDAVLNGPDDAMADRISALVSKLHWLELVYTQEGWYRFLNHRWVPTAKINFVLPELISMFEPLDATLVRKLNTIAFRQAVLTGAEEYCFDVAFLERLNIRDNLVGIDNGVMETDGDQIIFRAGKPEDYISWAMPTPYREDFTWEHPSVQGCVQWLRQVFVDPELYHYFLKFAASCLHKYNKDKIFPIFIGDGNNGKSSVKRLFQATLGPCCTQLDANILAGNDSMEDLAEKLVGTAGAHVGFIGESETNAPIRNNVITCFTSGDFFVRLMPQPKVRVTVKPILICNSEPIIPLANNATKNRVRFFPFQTQFVSKPITEDQPLQFQLDPTFFERIPSFAPAFLWMLVQYYPIYCQEGLQEPASVMARTAAYWQSNDVYFQFATAAIIEDSTAQLTVEEVYSVFKQWFKSIYGLKRRCPDRFNLRYGLEELWGPRVDGVWPGKALRV